MINIYKNGESIDKILTRTQLENDKVNKIVADIIKDIRENGDKALIKYAKDIDNTVLDSDSMFVSEKEIKEAYKQVDKELLETLRKAKANILSYHQKQMGERKQMFVDGGKQVGYVLKPIEKAGVYVPGGTASYPSSVLMGVLPAVVAGVKEIIMATPCKENYINPLTIVAGVECGVTKILKVGGAQSISALAFGTESVPKVNVITYPGNIFVTMAKKQVYGYVKIDMLAGPSEILVIADETANPNFLAADLLSQAEHDKLATAILLTTSLDIAEKTKECVINQVNSLNRKEILKDSLSVNSGIIVVKDLKEAFDIANKIAPEHLELCIKDAENHIDDIANAGAIFVGNFSPEPLGDYFAGPNHVLPTSGSAKYFEVLNVDTYLKKTSVINYDFCSLNEVKDDIIRLAECEGLDAHANAIKVRF